MEQPSVAELEDPRSPMEGDWLLVPWTRRDLLWATILGVFLLLALLVLMLVALQTLSLVTGLALPAGLLGTLVLVAELGLLLPVWALGVHKYRLSWRSVGFRGFHLGRGVGLGCLFLFVAFGFNLLWSVFLAVFGLDAQPDVLPLFGGGFGGLLMALLAGGLVAPVAEEAFFRGYLFAGLRRHWGRGPAFVLSGALFALVHILPTSWPPIFVLGTLFALLYEQTGSIWPAVAVHGLINSIGFVATYLLGVLGT